MESKTITIDFPGKFDSFFSLTGMAQGQVDDDIQRLLLQAYTDSRYIKRGKLGYTLRLTIPVDDNTREILQEIAEYGDYCCGANRDTVSDRTADPSDRDSARGEIKAARKVIAQAQALMKELER